MLSYWLKHFFYSVGLVALLILYKLDPNTADFKGFLLFFQKPELWRIVVAISFILIFASLMLDTFVKSLFFGVRFVFVSIANLVQKYRKTGLLWADGKKLYRE